MASNVYRIGKAKLQDESTGWTGGTIRAMLLNASHTFDADNDYVSDISANELTGYSRVTLTGCTLTELVTNAVKYDATDPVFSSVGTGQTATGMVLYYQVGGDDSTPADDILLFWVEFDAPVVTNGNNVNVTLSANGIATN